MSRAASSGEEVWDVVGWRMQAQEIAEQGQKLEATHPKRALSAYRSSLEIKVDAKVLYAVGRVCTRLADPACAATAYEGYLREAGSEITPARKREVDAALKTLTKGLARLTVKANVDGAIVKVDGNVAGKTPLAQPLALAAPSRPSLSEPSPSRRRAPRRSRSC